MREVTSGTDRVTEIADDEGLLSAELRQLGETRADPDFETLHRTYSRRLFKQIIAITRHHADAEDALQDAFHNALRGSASLRETMSSLLMAEQNRDQLRSDEGPTTPDCKRTFIRKPRRFRRTGARPRCPGSGLVSRGFMQC